MTTLLKLPKMQKLPRLKKLLKLEIEEKQVAFDQQFFDDMPHYKGNQEPNSEARITEDGDDLFPNGPSTSGTFKKHIFALGKPADV
uniref:AGC-kinase C-terminal domain-containing protein n=2 Tax=Caenorhabditis tropicalis TaxID=1561998 RepID=A0A1I7UPQ4_9PELO